jgi:hypothetical protein
MIIRYTTPAGELAIANIEDAIGLQWLQAEGLKADIAGKRALSDRLEELSRLGRPEGTTRDALFNRELEADTE